MVGRGASLGRGIMVRSGLGAIFYPACLASVFGLLLVGIYHPGQPSGPTSKSDIPAGDYYCVPGLDLLGAITDKGENLLWSR